MDTRLLPCLPNPVSCEFHGVRESEGSLQHQHPLQPETIMFCFVPMHQNGCPTAKELEEFSDGELAWFKDRRIKKHLEQCTDCQRALREAQLLG